VSKLSSLSSLYRKMCYIGVIGPGCKKKKQKNLKLEKYTQLLILIYLSNKNL